MNVGEFVVVKEAASTAEIARDGLTRDEAYAVARRLAEVEVTMRFSVLEVVARSSVPVVQVAFDEAAPTRAPGAGTDSASGTKSPAS